MRKAATAYPLSDLKDGEYVGIVEEIGFTQGGMGNQWTVIDGDRFVTYWDARTTDWRVGDHVRYSVRHRSFGYHNHGEPPPAPHAESIHRVEKDAAGKWQLAPRSK